MKILCASDHHCDEGSRFAEWERVHHWMVERAVEHQVELFISCGDIYERASTPKERLAVAQWVQLMAEQCPVLIIKGNHDTHRDLLLLAHLDAAHRIDVEEGAGVHVFGKLAIAAVAWPERARILARARELGAAGEAEHIAQDALRDVFRGLGAQLERWDGPRLAAGHMMVDGSVVSTGQPLIGQPMNVGLADLELLGAELVLLGHVHKPQHWEHGRMVVAYTGSPYRTAFGELEDKSVIVVDFDDYGTTLPLAWWQRLPTPCAGMFLIDDEWEHGGFSCSAMPAPADVRGAEIRFRYAVEPEERSAARADAARIKAGLLEHGAASVQIEECVRTITIARAPEVAAARGLGDKLQALWQARGTTPEPERCARLLEMASTLELEHP